MLKGISTSMRPVLPTTCTRWYGSLRMPTVKLDCTPPGNVSTAELSVSTPIVGSRCTLPTTSSGSAPTSRRAALMA